MPQRKLREKSVTNFLHLIKNERSKTYGLTEKQMDEYGNPDEQQLHATSVYTCKNTKKKQTKHSFML